MADAPLIAPPPTAPAAAPGTPVGPTVPVLTPDGQVAQVPQEQVGGLLAQGYKLNPTARDVALGEAAQHPFEAAGEAGLGSLIPGGRRLLTDTKEHQALLAEANPTATTLGTLAGGVGQAAAVGALTGGLGEAAEVGALTGGLGEAAEGAELAGNAAEAAPGLLGAVRAGLPTAGEVAKSFATNALMGVTQGMSEQDLGDTGYNAESLAIDGGLAGVLGLGVDSAFSVGKALVPRAIEAARGSLSTLDDVVGRALGRASAAATGEPSLAEAIPEALAERRAGGPLSKFAKKAALAEQRDTAVDLAGALNDTMDSVADVAENHFGEIRPVEAAVDAAEHDANGGLQAAETGAQSLIKTMRAGLQATKDEIAPALISPGETLLGEAKPSWPKAINAAETYLNRFEKSVNEGGFESSAELHSEARQLRQLTQRALKFGNKLEGTDLDAANGIQHQMLAPLQDFLGRYGENGVLTPESVAAFGAKAADRNAVINKAWNQLKTAQDNLEPILGTTFKTETGRPDIAISPAKVEALIRGEGLPGEIPNRLSSLRAKTALDNYLATARNYVNVAEESATRSNVETGSAAKARGLINDVIEKRAAAQDQLGSALGPKMQRVADLTSLTGQGAGGLRGSLANAGATGAELAAGALGLGHPVVGAAVGAIGLAKRAFVAAKYPVETLNTYVNITQSAARVAGMVSAGIRKILASPLTEGAKRAGVAVTIAGIGSQEQLDAARKTLATDSKTLTAYNENPAAMAHALAENTAGLAQHAPQHASGVAATGLRAAAALSAALPRNPAPPSPLGPGHDHWAPSDGQVVTYAQIRRAVLDPKTVLGDWKNGTQTVAAWNAFCQVHPQISQLVAHKAQLEAVKDQDNVLDIGQKFILSQLCHFPVSQELSPASIAAQQAVFAAQPTPPPQGGSPKGTRHPVRSAGLDKLTLSDDTAFPGSAPGAEGE